MKTVSINRFTALILTVVIVAAGIGVFLFVDLYRSQQASRHRDAAALHEGLDLIGDLQSQVQEGRRTLLYALATTDSNVQVEYADQSRAADAQVEHRLADYLQIGHGKEQVASVQKLADDWAAYLAVRDGLIAQILEGETQAAIASDLREGVPAFNAMQADIGKTQQLFKSNAELRLKELESSFERSLLRIGFVLALIAVLGGVSAKMVQGRTVLSALRLSEAKLRQDFAEAQREERATAALLSAATESSIIGTTPSGVVAVFNAGAERLLGYRCEEVIGKLTLEQFHDPEEVAARAGELEMVPGFEVLVAAARRGEAETREWTYVRKDGSRFPVSLSVTAIYDAAGALTGFIGIAADITQRRRAEEQMHAAKSAAEAANRAKSEFLANMSHEIRTPMNGIIGMTELVLETQLDREQREYLGMAKTSAHALLGLINDILDFSKIEAGKLELEAISFSLRDCLGTAIKPLGMRADKKGLELTAEIAADVPDHVIGAPMRLRQILINLTDNALKFTERSSVVVKVTADACADGEQCLHFAITDTGIGIPPEKQGVIFEAFAQVDGSTTRNYGGTGLGLAIVSQLIAQMHGKVWIESTVGEGTTFHFTAWFGVGEPVAEDSHALALEPTEARDLPARPLRILLAEDNVINRALATALLERRGHSLVHAVNGREAVAAAAGAAFDLILMDVQMPEMDGFQATARIREIEAPLGRHTPIAAMTAHAMSGDRERCLAAGMDDYISKPLEKAELLALLQRNTAPLEVSRAQAPQSLCIFTREQLLDQLDDDEELLQRMIVLFESNTPQLLEDIRGSIARQRGDELARAAHALLSSVGAFGAKEAHRLALQLAELGRGGEFTRVGVIFAQLEAETESVRAALENLACTPSAHTCLSVDAGALTSLL